MQRFDKYEGLGNDFVVVSAAEEAAVTPAQARRLCDRRLGIGADGVLLVLPPRDAAAAARMLVLNADGSRPEMCGNGLRCVALHLARTEGVAGGRLQVETDAGLKRCVLAGGGDAAQVEIELGAPRYDGELEVEHAGAPRRFTLVSMGNPHAVVFDAALREAQMDDWGAAVSARFPEGTNVEFAEQTGPRELSLVVWERGVGRTLACGTGAGATVAAAARAGRVPYGEPVSVRLPGGPLEVWVEPGDLGVRLRGPARFVYSGQVTLP